MFPVGEEEKKESASIWPSRARFTSSRIAHLEADCIAFASIDRSQEIR
jgi:hypothetical protein